MTEQEKIFFEKLHKRRVKSVESIFEDDDFGGVKDMVVNKYSDQAHFIYELLQNADDVQATSVRFILEPDQLIFAHNGLRHFSVSDPDTTKIDKENGRRGDINAITAIGNSNKTTEESIGKFGVGFKAVFQYTSTPHIYDPNFQFRIENLIVPVLLNQDFPGRRQNETLFMFPFDHPEQEALEACNDIERKLRNLLHPLLFLTNLKKIEFKTPNTDGLYEKKVQETREIDSTTVERVVSTYKVGEQVSNDELWLFSRRDEKNRKYSVGFFTDQEGQLRPVNHLPAFCFFPTKKSTDLKFIIHAPFWLTDSREGIRADNLRSREHNGKMISLLSELAADALVYLRDIGTEKSIRLINDRILDLIPIGEENFTKLENTDEVSFLPFYQAIEKKFRSEALLPSKNGYVRSENAYWADTTQLTQLFSDEQLGLITDNPKAQWVFVTRGRGSAPDNIREFVDLSIRTYLNDKVIREGRGDWDPIRHCSTEPIRGISKSFIKQQTTDWLCEFYKWLSDRPPRMSWAKKAPIFWDVNGQAVAAFDSDEKLILFLPTEDVDMSNYTVVHPDLLNNKDIRKFIIEEMKVKEPLLEDRINNIILPRYENGEAVSIEEADSHFKLFYQHYCECLKEGDEKVDEFIDLIKDYEFLTYECPHDQQPRRGAASSMYFPTSELQSFLETKEDSRFVQEEKYQELIGKSKKSIYLESFLNELGVKREISIYEQEIDASSRNFSSFTSNGFPIRYFEKIIEGCRELIAYIVENKDKEKSCILWKHLKEVEDINENITGKSKYRKSHKGNKEYEEPFESSDAVLLRNEPWILDSEGEFKSAKELNVESLAGEYDRSSEGAERLIKFLGIAEKPVEDDASLTDEQREKIKMANRLKECGIANEADLEEALEVLRALQRQKEVSKQKHESAQKRSPSDSPKERRENSSEEDMESFEDDEDKEDKVVSSWRKGSKPNRRVTKVIKDIVRRTKGPSLRSEKAADSDDIDDGIGQDEFNPLPVDYSERIKSAQQKSAAEIDKILYLEELQNKAVQAKPYSFVWFKTLLEMEAYINGGEIDADSREVSISFAKVEREPGTARILVLEQPSQRIPRTMEDLDNISLKLHMENQAKSVPIEVANIRSYTLRVRVKNSEDIEQIDFSAVTAATIDAKSPQFLLRELKKQFEKLDFSDEYDMRQNLCENIKFIFGPPGTGKTTYLAKDILLPKMREEGECKILVLTPTNKAADVLARRIMEASGSDHSYEDWLVRFGTTGDENIEKSVLKDKTFDIRKPPKNITITTIARFPYDFFMPQGSNEPIYLREIQWDYIVIDEASMIPLANIVYPLYKKTPAEFIIAGDPFQIEPITSVNIWKNENIYSLVELDSFENPKTTPHEYEVIPLTTQYRSVPQIGEIFSKLTYGGVLKHNREASSQRALKIGTELGLETVNIIKFPVSKYESIYRSKRLYKSSYQIYSALFTFEYVRYLAEAIAKNNPGDLFKIGIIAPYRAQKEIIDKMIAAERLPKEVEIQAGTIHGFQGDECDIIFAVFNTPSTITGNKEMFLNKKNIINVAISRARDYLFIVMPDDKTENIENLRLVKSLEHLAKNTGACGEFSSSELEALIFGDPQFLEKNVFATSHQSVNVYDLPETYYEVRTEENAVDVQIHRDVQLIKEKISD